MKEKSIAKNSIYNVIYKGFTAIFPLFTTVYIARVLLPEGVGRVEYANTIVTYFTTLAALGIPNYGVKAIAQTSQNKKEKSRTFWELFFINMISTIICLAVYFIFVNLVPHFQSRRVLFNVMGLMLFFNIFNSDWFYQGIEEYSYIAVRSVVIKILSFVAMLLFVKSVNDYVIYALILCIATAGNYLFNTVHLKRYICFEWKNLQLKKHLKPVFILLAAAIATQIYTMLDTIMLEYVLGERYVGYYSNAVKVVRMIYTVAIAVVTPFYPRISRLLKEKKYSESNKLLSEGLKLIIIVALPCIAGLFMTSEYIVAVLFGNAFNPTIVTLKILSILVGIFSVAYFLGHIVLMSVAKENKILLATICGAIINAIANIIMIPIFEHNGAAIASVLAELIVTIVLVSESKKYFCLYIERKFVTTELVAVVIMIVEIYILRLVVPVNIYGFFFIVFVSIILYFGTLLVLKNPEILRLINKVRSKRNKKDEVA